MASGQETVYFPPLDRCLSGQEPVVPWVTALDTLIYVDETRDSLTLESFLTNDHTLSVLANALRPFQEPSESTRNEFETRTAPINVSHSANGDFDLAQLKDDALWLSKEVRISEISALRLVIVEWQKRPADWLLVSQFEEGGPTSVKNTANGNTKAGVDIVTRHKRLLNTYLREGNAIKKLAAIMASLDAGESTPLIKSEHWIGVAAEKLRKMQPRRDANSSDSRASASIEVLSRAVEQLADSKKWPEVFQRDLTMHDIYLSSVLRDMVSVLRLILLHIFSMDSAPTPQTISAWFNLMQSTSFFGQLAPANTEHMVYCERLQCLVAITSAAIVKLPHTIAELQKTSAKQNNAVSYPQLGPSTYIEDDGCIREVNLILFHAAASGSPIASPAVFAWSIITMYIRDIAREESRLLEDGGDGDASGSSRPNSVTRRPSAMELKLEALQDISLGEVRDDPPQYLARQAVDTVHVHAVIADICRMVSTTYLAELEIPTAQICRTVLQDVVRETLPTVAYDGNVIEAILALLAPETLVNCLAATPRTLIDDFLNDKTHFCPLVMDQALARYPYELSPLLRLLNALARGSIGSSREWPPVTQILDNMLSVTLTLPEGFRGYTLEHEEEAANAFVLTDHLPLFLPAPSLQYFPDRSNQGILAVANESQQSITNIPTDTPGVILKDSRPFVVKLAHPHSGLEYFGLLLSTIRTNSDTVVAPPGATLDILTASEIIGLLATLLKGSSSKDDAEFILGRVSTALPDELDIVAIIVEIMEVELLAYVDQSSKEGSMDLLVSGLHFLDALSPFCPERVWSVLSSSSLLGVNSGASAIASVAGSAEVQAGDLRFLSACMKIYESLINDTVRGLVRRKQRTSAKSSNRFDSPMDSPGHTPGRTMMDVLAAFTKIALDTVQSLAGSTLSTPQVKAEVTTSVLKALDQLVLVVYGIGGDAPDKQLTETLRPAAEITVSALLPTSLSAQPTLPFIELLASSMQLDDECLSSIQRVLIVRQNETVLKFLTTLVRIAKHFKRSSDTLALELIKHLLLITTQFAVHSALRAPVCELLTEMVTCAGQSKSEPPSLLSRLDSEQARQFLCLVTNLDSPMKDITTECALWDFFSATVGCRQPWFAMYLLTGSLPRERISGREQSTDKKSVFLRALETLVDIKNLTPERAIAMLNFVANAQKLWIWATSLVRQHSDFLKNALAWLDELKPCPRSATTADALLAAKEHVMAATLCDILAVNLHASLEVNDRSLVKLLVPKLGFLAEHAARVDGYNRSLQRNLADNFSKRFVGCEVADLKRTDINPGHLGKNYIYDTEVAEQMLGHDEAWSGSRKSKSHGFAEEFARVNVNMSLMDAQIRLLTNWKVLATTLSDCMDLDSGIVSLLVKAVECSLQANVDTSLNEPHAAALLQTRADLTFVLMTKLVKRKSDVEQMRGLLSKAWLLVRTSAVDYDVASAPEDLTYYRTLLQILFLSLQPHSYMESAQPAVARPRTSDSKVPVALDPSVASTLLDIISKAIAPAFRALCSNLHDSMETALPSDFALLIALMRAILSVRGAPQIHVQIADAIAASSPSVIRGALSLYSWSDRLAEATDHDPVYGETAITFLVTLSSVPQVAEQMALEGALARLGSANVSNHLRKPGGKGPFDAPARAFAIWADGLLPLCLNLLDAVGPPVAAEVSAFVNSFPQQLARASRALQPAQPTPRSPRAGAVTRGLLAEARGLVLVAQVLRSAVALGAAEGIAAADVEELRYDVQAVRDDVEAMSKGQRGLRDRIAPATERDVELARQRVGNGDDGLQAAVLRELSQVAALFEE